MERSRYWISGTFHFCQARSDTETKVERDFRRTNPRIEFPSVFNWFCAGWDTRRPNRRLNRGKPVAIRGLRANKNLSAFRSASNGQTSIRRFADFEDRGLGQFLNERLFDFGHHLERAIKQHMLHAAVMRDLLGPRCRQSFVQGQIDVLQRDLALGLDAQLLERRTKAVLDEELQHLVLLRRPKMPTICWQVHLLDQFCADHPSFCEHQGRVIPRPVQNAVSHLFRGGRSLLLDRRHRHVPNQLPSPPVP